MNRVNEALAHLQENSFSQEDYNVFYDYLLYHLNKKGGAQFFGESEEDIIQEFFEKKLYPNIMSFKNHNYLARAFSNFLTDKKRAEKSPEARLFKKIENQLKKFGCEKINPEGYLYQKPKTFPDGNVTLEELDTSELPEVEYKAYKDDSKKEDEIIKNKDLNGLIKQVLEKVKGPIDIRKLNKIIQTRIKGFTKGVRLVSFEKKLSEDRESGISKKVKDVLENEENSSLEEGISDLIDKEVFPNLEEQDLKALYNELVEELTPEEEAEKEKCSSQTVRNRRKIAKEKISNILKDKEFSEEEMKIFAKILKKELEKRLG